MRNKDPVLRAILAHNRDEEKEHAAMLMEWIRRNDGTFEKEMRDYLFTKKAADTRLGAGAPRGDLPGPRCRHPRASLFSAGAAK